MGQSMGRRRQDSWPDLAEYGGCPDDRSLGMLPLAAGWLQRGQPFAQGRAPASFLARLLPFCQPEHTVCTTPAARPCPLCGLVVPPYGGAEVRVIGQSDIFAAPDLIYHYVEAHAYLPPPPFIEAVLDGPAPGSPVHRALRRAYT